MYTTIYCAKTYICKQAVLWTVEMCGCSSAYLGRPGITPRETQDLVKAF